RAAVQARFGRVCLTLLDTHVSALISAAFLFQIGTGPVRGFAVSLSIGLVSNLFTSTFVSRTFFELVLAGRKNVSSLSICPPLLRRLTSVSGRLIISPRLGGYLIPK